MGSALGQLVMGKSSRELTDFFRGQLILLSNTAGGIHRTDFNYHRDQ